MLRRNFLSSLAAPWLLSGTSLAWGSGLSLYPHGSRRFVLGLYELPKVADPWREAQDAGCNLVHVSPSPENFEKAREHQMRTWVSLGSISENNRVADEARIQGIVEKYRHEPPLLFWETADEPAYTRGSPKLRIAPEEIIATHDFVKKLDPSHPLYLNHAPVNLESTLTKYNAGAEIIAMDIYPVIPHGIRDMFALWPTGRQGDFLNATISQVGDYTEKMRRVAGPSRPLLMVLQAFAWEDLRGKDRDPAMVLYPDRAQLRSMAYQAIVHGADGLLFWGLASNPPGAPVWKDLSAVLSELSQIESELSSPPLKRDLRIEYHDTGHSLDRGIEWTMRPAAKGALLLTVNSDENPVEARITLPAGVANCQVVRTEEVIRVSRGMINLSYAPFEAKALRIR